MYRKLIAIRSESVGVYTLNLLRTVTLGGGAYDGGGAYSVGEQGHVIRRSGR